MAKVEGGRRILIVHQNFPGQFPHIVEGLLKAGHKLAAIGGSGAKGRPGVDLRRWSLNRGTTKGIFDPATRIEADLMRSYAAANVALQLKADGFTPDLIIGHPGWGETLQLGEVWPEARQIAFGEFFYRSHGADVGFDAEFESHTPSADMRVYSKNAGLALAYSAADVIVCPTPFQASHFPEAFKPRIRVLHEGIDIGRSARKPSATLMVRPGVTLDGRKPVITFINRNFERLRGFHIFMRALPQFQQLQPDADIVIIGADQKGYGGALPDGQTWRTKMLAELDGQLDLSRIHFTGPLSHGDMISALSISWAHVYYTYPFILSWSLVEAMACECLILGSDTPPVRDAITSGENGLLNDFFDPAALASAMNRACETPEAFRVMRRRAKETAQSMFDRATVGVPGWLTLVQDVLDR